MRQISLAGPILASLVVLTGLVPSAAAHSHEYLGPSVVVLSVGEIGPYDPDQTEGSVSVVDFFFTAMGFTYCQSALGLPGCQPGVADQLLSACTQLAITATTWNQAMEVIVIVDTGTLGGIPDVCANGAVPTIGLVSHS